MRQVLHGDGQAVQRAEDHARCAQGIVSFGRGQGGFGIHMGEGVQRWIMLGDARQAGFRQGGGRDLAACQGAGHVGQGLERIDGHGVHPVSNGGRSKEGRPERRPLYR